MSERPVTRPSLFSSAMRVFDLSLGEMLWSRRTIFMAEKAWAGIMIFFGLANVAVAFLADFEIWALYATFVPTTIIVALFFVQYAVFQRLAQRNAQARAVAGT